MPLIGSCAKIGCVQSERKCHGKAIKNGVNYELAVQNSSIQMYARCGNVGLPHKVFDEMVIPDFGLLEFTY